MESSHIESGSRQTNRSERDPEVSAAVRSAISYAEGIAREEHATRWSPDVAVNFAIQHKDSLGETKWHEVKKALEAAPKKVVTLASFTKRRRH
jgi:hypothetical protein